MADYERHDLDVLVIGAGGAGMRAAVEAAGLGAKTGLVCKSLLGKAHTVMAEGGMAAAMANVWPEDNWQVHFRDTMRGGKMLNNWRMAQLHAQEAPDRVYELEEWGALFDRTPDGRILQRDFGGHRYARLAHIGDRTGLELIRTLQHHMIHRDVDVFMECKVVGLLKDGDRIAGALAYWREHGTFVVFAAKAVIVATGGAGKIYKYTSNSWECSGDGHALALWAGAELIDMEFFQLHPTGMIWPLSARGLLVTEGVRGDGGVLRNSEGERFMYNYIPEFFKAETADTTEEADRWYDDHINNRRPAELLPRDEVARAINSEVKAGRGSPHGGAFLDIASRRSEEEIKRRLPSMYHQFKHLADVDITKEAMEVGPTAHYIMGGVRVDADTQATRVPGLYAAGECSGGMHGANRLGGNSLSDLVVFGKRAGQYAAAYALGLVAAPAVDAGQVDALRQEALAPLNRESGENPYTLHQDLQEVMQDLVGIIRVESEMRDAIDAIEVLKDRAKNVSAEGHVQYNPGWGEATDLPALLTVAECVARAALERKESRGGHTRDDYPMTDPQWARVNNRVSMPTPASGGVVVNPLNERVGVDQIPLPEMPEDLKKLFEEAH
jgi:succinate dehydrogenase / fumarate reductase flavoprotein subunit